MARARHDSLRAGPAGAPRPRRRARPASRAAAALSVLLALALPACGGAGSQAVLELQVGAAPGLAGRLWPAPPDVPRYRYVGELVGEQNFRSVGGERQGGALRFWRWLSGLDQARREPVVLQRPQSGATDPQGRVYVTDVSRQAVFVFDAPAGALRLWEHADGRRRFVAPVGIALDHQGRVLVTDAELGAVFRFRADGTFEESFGHGILRRPTGIAIDAARHEIYVADTGAHDVKVFDAAGRLLDTLGGPGSDAGSLNHPVYLAFAGEHLYVSDALNARVQVFDRHGTAVAVIGRRGLYVGNLTRPKGVAVDGEGHVYVVEGFYDHLLVFQGDGQLLMTIGGTGQRPGEFFLPTGVWTDARNRIYVADMFNGRVSIFQFLGEEQ